MSIICSFIAIIVALTFIVIMAFKGHSPLPAALVAAVLLSFFAGVSIQTALTVNFAQGAANMVQRMLVFHLACTLFGGLMERAKYAESIAYFLADHIPVKYAPITVVLASLLLGMGGMSIGVAIIMYPIGMILFSKAGYSRRVLAGACFGSYWTIACCSPFIPSGGNNLLQEMLGTGPDAGAIPGTAASVFMLLFLCVYTMRRAKSDQKKGIVFESDEEIPPDNPEERKKLPNVFLAVLPIIIVLIGYNLLKLSVAVDMFIASIWIILLNLKMVKGFDNWWGVVEEMIYRGVMPTINQAAVGGLGSLISATPFFSWLLAKLSTSTVNPYLVCFLSANVMAGLVGSGVSGLGTLVPSMMPLIERYVAQGYDIGVIHRMLSIGSVGLDSLPQNGSLIAAFTFMHTNHKESYRDTFVTCCVSPIVAGFCIALPLAMLGFK